MLQHNNLGYEREAQICGFSESQLQSVGDITRLFQSLCADKLVVLRSRSIVSSTSSFALLISDTCSHCFCTLTIVPVPALVKLVNISNHLSGCELIRFSRLSVILQSYKSWSKS